MSFEDAWGHLRPLEADLEVVLRSYNDLRGHNLEFGQYTAILRQKRPLAPPSGAT